MNFTHLPFIPFNLFKKKALSGMLFAWVLLSFLSCTDWAMNAPFKSSESVLDTLNQTPPNMQFGFDLNQFEVKEKRIRRDDTFGDILEENGIDYPQVHTILDSIKGTLSMRKLQIGKKYFFLYSKENRLQPKYFIYLPNALEYAVVQLSDSIYGKKVVKEVRTVEMRASGVIESSLYETIVGSGINEELIYQLADVYAWSIDFFRLHKGDRFKVIYTEKFVDDTLSIGMDKIKAAYFEHAEKPFYAFDFIVNQEKGLTDYFDDKAKNLRRAFLRGPVKYRRISSRYNLRRRIAYYGNRIKPHKGTDFAARVGTPILATANGTVVKSSYTRGNGNYVTIKHNNVYATQYLHMKRRNVRVGQFVKQGEVIGWVGMTGYTSGPHVCYRFWKHGRQVDPFREKLPDAKPISEDLKVSFLEYLEPLKEELDCIPFYSTSDSSERLLSNNHQTPDEDPS